MTPTRMAPQNLAEMLKAAILAATESLCIAKQNAVGVILEKEGFYDLDCMFRWIDHDIAGFILCAAPGFDLHLKRATGRGRDAWAALLN